MLNQLFYNRFIELKFQRYNHTSVNASLLSCVFFYIIGTQYLHVRHPGKDKSFRTCISRLNISNHNKVWCPHQKFKVSFFIYFCCFWINVIQINFENIKKRYEESFMIIVSSWNCDIILMLERPLSHYWSAPLSLDIHFNPSPIYYLHVLFIKFHTKPDFIFKYHILLFYLQC